MLTAFQTKKNASTSLKQQFQMCAPPPPTYALFLFVKKVCIEWNPLRLSPLDVCFGLESFRLCEWSFGSWLIVASAEVFVAEILDDCIFIKSNTEDCCFTLPLTEPPLLSQPFLVLLEANNVSCAPWNSSDVIRYRYAGFFAIVHSLQPPDVGLSVQPMHHNSPAYDGGDNPSNAKRSLR